MLSPELMADNFTLPNNPYIFAIFVWLTLMVIALYGQIWNVMNETYKWK